MTLEDVKVALDSNLELTDELRDNIYGLVHIFNEKYPDISLNNLCNNLHTLKIVKSNKFLNKRVSKYNYMTNTIEFNVNVMNEGYDMKHVFMYDLLQVITNNGVMTGFNQNDQFRALNAGYTEILTNNLVGNESDIGDLDSEIISTNIISYILGDEILFNAYFNNDANLLTNAMLEKGFNNFEIMKAMNYAYDNPEFRDKVNPHELCVDVAIKSVIDPNRFEQIRLLVSMSHEAKAYKKALDGFKAIKTMDDGMDRVRAM